MMVVVCCSFGDGLILAALAASIAAAARRPNSLFRITAHAECQFLDDLNATATPYQRPIGVPEPA